jgi:hypothetical protein
MTRAYLCSTVFRSFIVRTITAMGFTVPHAESSDVITKSHGTQTAAGGTVQHAACAECLQLRTETEDAYGALWASEHTQSELARNACRDRWLRARHAQKDHRSICDAKLATR